MKMSSKSRYGLRALIDIAVNGEKEPVSIASIATRRNLSEAYLEQLIAKLKKAGMVQSLRGAQGGYQLAKPANEISVGDVLRVLEGDLDAVDCPGLTDSGCASADACVTLYVWQKINESIADTVDHIMLDTLVQESIKSGEGKVSNEGNKTC